MDITVRIVVCRGQNMAVLVVVFVAVVVLVYSNGALLNQRNLGVDSYYWAFTVLIAWTVVLCHTVVIEDINFVHSHICCRY